MVDSRTIDTQCPDRARLQQLLLGLLPEVEAVSLERHVERCGRCAQVLPGVWAEDGLVETMQNLPDLKRPPAERKVIAQLITQLYQLQDADTAPCDVVAILRPPEAADEIGRLGQYRILKRLGQGGMGVVFLAEDPLLCRTVALKVMRPDVAKKASARERFLREARATARIEHDHIVPIYQVGEDNGVPFLAMQLLKGHSLEDYLLKNESASGGSPVPLAQLLRVGYEIARGLAAAHEQGLIHRDIKPANIWLETLPEGHSRVKILDFGLALVDEGDNRLTRLGTILGTPAYMAPEQILGSKIDARADLFSLGCLLYRLGTGRLPFRGVDALETMAAVLREEPPPLREANPDLPPRVVGLIWQLLAKKPADRPESARVVAETLRTLQHDPPSTRVKKAVPRLPPVSVLSVRRVPHLWNWPLGVGLLAGLMISILAVGWFLLPYPSGAPKTSKGLAGKGFTNSIGVQMAAIPAGTFRMGSTRDEISRIENEPFKGYAFPGWETNESPAHEVRHQQGFYLGIHEVTQGQYERVTGKNPSSNKESPNHPVEQVTWMDATRFCEALTNLPAEKAAGRTYRLPTEAEWEYACRAGTTTFFNTGATLTSRQANIDGDSPFGTAEKGPRRGRTIAVGSFPPNAWGLHDMHGNVFEWCLDGMRIYTPDAVIDPHGPETAECERIVRGGGWANGACRSGFRKARSPLLYHTHHCGFRVLCPGSEPR